MSGVDPKRMADAYVPDFGIPWQPVLPREELAKMSETDLVAYAKARREVEEWNAKNPVGSGWKLPMWDNVLNNWVTHRVHVICGGNRATKSTLAARLMVWGMGTIPEFEGRAWHVNGERSKQDQQRIIHENLPSALKNLPTKSGANHQTRWSQANGFTGDKVILPPLAGCSRGGSILFQNYASFSNDAQVAEGFKAHIIWLDEEAPVELFKTLMQRTTDYHGRIILTFTTLNGWTPLVAELLSKVRTLEWKHAPLVGKKLPVLQENLQHDGMLIHYFHTEDNPFIDVEEFRSKMRGLSTEEKLARAYGVPTKGAKAAFPLFSRDVHVLDKHEDLPWLKNPDYKVTRYMIVDPGGAKNDFIGWVAIDAAGTFWCYREWPDFDTYGEWSLPGPTVDGKAGPAQQSLGWGFEREAEEIAFLEDGEAVFERLVDPRMGAQEKKAEEGATNYITDFEKHDIVLRPAPGVDIKSGIKKINELLQYDPEKPRDSRNSPRIFFSPKCGNWIQMMQDYTASSATEHTKEGPDLLRYLVTANPIFVGDTDMEGRGTSGSY